MHLFEAGPSKIASLPQAKPVAAAVAETMTTAPGVSVLSASKHIFLEGYPLIKDKTGPPRVPSNEEIKLISEMFHETYEVSVNVSYMIVRCHNLPKKPWPLTIGGMPLWITSDATETPEIEGRGGRAPPIMEQLPFSKFASPTGQHFNSIAQNFLNSLNVIVSEIMWNGVQLRLTISDDVRPERLPFKIGKLLAVYNKTNAIPEHQEVARRLITPSATVRDDTCYIPPGLLIGDTLTMENSFSGLCEGIFMASIWKSIPADENPHKLPWVVISNFYLGNGGEEPLNGSCGSPVVTEIGEVIGLFRFMTNNGKAYCVSVEVLMETGHSFPRRRRREN